MNWRISIVILMLTSTGLAVDVTKTVKPAGGGDFTTVQAAIDWAKTNVFTPTNLVIECYTGGNLGTVWLISQAWYPKPATITIKAAAGNAHNGKIPTTGCYIFVPSGYPGVNVMYGWSVPVLIKNLTVITTNGASYGIGTSGDYGAKNYTIDGNLIYHVGTSADKTTRAMFFEEYDAGVVTNIVVRNNIIYGGSTTNYAQGIYLEGQNGTQATFKLYNNTIQRCLRGTWYFRSAGPFPPASEIYLTQVNDVIMNCRTCFTWGVNSTVSSNNMSSDATADDAGGSNHKVNKTASDQFVNVLSDFNLKATADAKDAGKTLFSFSWDARGVTRPQGPAWDMGALEYPVSKRRVTKLISDMLSD